MTSRSARNALVALVAATTLLTGAAGCGGGSGGAPPVAATLTPTVSDGVQVFDVIGQVDQTFSAGELVASPGTIRVDFSVVKGSAPHNFVIETIPGASTKILRAGESQSITFTVSEPGRYPVVCTLHQGMTATLVIR
ncbi:plastocyanin [Frankia sp. EI5c]|uniref:cupredoxin domain-containing protein n=1 Tax=Frankia sp. EI5c TaxID=683316 RepID=UPI0007C20EAF|nr:cupredoxin domain-containing protein [Frankia sp. EI5c]OAA27049.1 plastocyanin [Frankia sp. EI5c]